MGAWFQSTLPEWGATVPLLSTSCGRANFNPRSPDGEQHGRGLLRAWPDRIPIHAPRMGSDRGHPGRRTEGPISIHAPRMGSDKRANSNRCRRRYFNPRSPDGERRPTSPPENHCFIHFNPRSPDGERPASPVVTTNTFDFNPRSPDGERRQNVIGHEVEWRISIHAPRVGSDRRGVTPDSMTA